MRVVTFALALGLLALAAPSNAQVHFGAQLPWADDFDWGIGARAVFDTDTVVPATRVAASFDLYFPETGRIATDVDFWQFNANALYALPFATPTVDWYAGAGLHFYHFESEIDPILFPGASVGDDGLGLNLLGGIDVPLGSSVTPFFELKVEVGGAEQWMLTGGLMF